MVLESALTLWYYDVTKVEVTEQNKSTFDLLVFSQSKKFKWEDFAKFAKRCKRTKLMETHPRREIQNRRYHFKITWKFKASPFTAEVFTRRVLQDNRDRKIK